MADSVDRVFSHALNTVNKIRTGSQKPPSATRLKLYGLYKQSMEGNVEGIMDRPTGNDEASMRAREKWDSWKAQSGLSRTEAKRRYIETLISTMHKYASPTPDARELVSELEFVWDQVKSNVPSSAGSSPVQGLGVSGMHSSMPRFGSEHAGSPVRGKDRSSRAREEQSRGRGRIAAVQKDELRVLSPMSRDQEEELSASDEQNQDQDEEDPVETCAEDEEEFVDARDSQIVEPPPNRFPLHAHSTPNPSSRPANDRADSQDPFAKHPSNKNTSRPPTRKRERANTVASSHSPNTNSSSTSRDPKWRSRVESALVKLTAEVAALREQLEARRLFTYSRHYRVTRWLFAATWSLFKHIAIDAILLFFVLLWLRRKQDKRLEGAIRVLLGDAVATMQKVGHLQLVKAKGVLPALPQGVLPAVTGGSLIPKKSH